MPDADATSPPPRLDTALLDRPVETRDLAMTAPDGCGGECVFIGRTRAERHAEHGELEALHYDAYRPMAEGVLRRIAADVGARTGALSIVVRHSVGRVRVGEASVGIAVFAGHRAEAFAACRELIDRVKAEAPIWKRELWTGGASWQAGTQVATGAKWA
jgi:molybdopterin synthase catalytic subunit